MKIEIQGGPLRCTRCSRSPLRLVQIHRGKPYCSLPCILQVIARELANDLSAGVDQGRGGSPVVLQAARDLISNLEHLEAPKYFGMDGEELPASDHILCPSCWREAIFKVGGERGCNYCADD